MAKEKILCIPRKNLPAPWVGERSVTPVAFDEFIRVCTQAGYLFVNRPEAENDNTLKQIIPYIVLQTQDASQTAVYKRQGSEQRLHDLWSLGIGGHINPEDQASADPSFKDILLAGMNRELTEELAQRPLEDRLEFKGLINEEITDVGSVHTGAVFRILTGQPEQYRPGEELSQFQWVETRSLKELNMELWSELALALLFFPR